MSLNEDDRKTVVKLQMNKARLFLEQADQMCKQQYWDIASNRYYYAWFHAIQALFIQNGISCHTHDGLITLFGLHFVKTGKVKSHLGAFLSRIEQLRKKGDYNCLFSVSKDEILSMVNPAKELIQTVEDLLNE